MTLTLGEWEMAFRRAARRAVGTDPRRGNLAVEEHAFRVIEEGFGMSPEDAFFYFFAEARDRAREAAEAAAAATAESAAPAEGEPENAEAREAARAKRRRALVVYVR